MEWSCTSSRKPLCVQITHSGHCALLALALDSGYTSGSHLIYRTEMLPLSFSILCKQIPIPGVGLRAQELQAPSILTQLANDSKGHGEKQIC